MHRIFARQLEKATDGDGTVDVARLGELVSASYEEYDMLARLNRNGLAALQEELESANRHIREEAEARFTVMMDNVGEAVVIIDEHGIVEEFNKAAERIFGYSSAQVIGRNVTLLMTAPDAAHHDETLRRYMCTGVGHIIGKGREVTARRSDGDEFPIELAVGELPRRDRRRFLGVIRDISERKQVERQLRESEGRFRDLAGSASDWFWETDADYRLVFVSDRIANVLGVKPSAILGSSFFDIGLGDGDPAQAAMHRSMVAARQPFRDVVFPVGPDEGVDAKIIRISGIPAFDDHGDFIGYRGIGVDITREAAAERNATLAQQQLVDAIESMVDGIAVYGADDRLVVCNGNYRTIFGQIRDGIRPGIPFEDVLRLLVERNAFATEGVTAADWFERRMDMHRKASGEPFVVRMSDDRWILNREYRTSDGGVVGVRTDITELKRREAELDTLRRRYQLILDSAGEGIVGLDCSGQVMFANKMACELLRVQAHDLVGRCFRSTVHHPDSTIPLPRRDETAIGRACLIGAAEQITGDLFRRFDGTAMHVDYQVAPIIEADRIAGAVVVFRDAELRQRYEQGLVDQQRELERLVAERTRELRSEVDIRARTEEALRESRERLRTIADSLFEGVLVVDRAGQLMFANASARALLGIDAVQGDIEGLPLDGLMQLRQADTFVDFAHSPWRQVVADGEVFRDDDAVFATGAGTILPVAYACTPLKEGGPVRGTIISFRDIQSLKQAQREALQASRLATVGQLAAGIAHEINTPVQYVGDNLRFFGKSLEKLKTVVDAATALAAPEITAAAAAVKLPFLLEELPVALEESLDGVAQIARIVLSMKEFSHPGGGTKSMTDINRAIESTLTVSRNTWKHVAELHKDLDPALPPVPCLAGELNQVFLNLIVNAAHAIEDSGKPLPGVLTVATALVGDVVEIRVADSGNGVPESIRDRIFDPFFTTKDVGKGTGQGLAICRDVVVTKHSGEIRIDGQPGEGAIFIVRLPIEDKRAAGG